MRAQSIDRVSNVVLANVSALFMHAPRCDPLRLVLRHRIYEERDRTELLSVASQDKTVFAVFVELDHAVIHYKKVENRAIAWHYLRSWIKIALHGRHQRLAIWSQAAQLYVVSHVAFGREDSDFSNICES